MRTILIVTFVLWLAPTATTQATILRSSDANSPNATQTRANAEQSEFRRLAKEWKDAYNSRNAARVAALYSEDADYISSHVAGLVAHGREKIRANFQAGIEAGGHIDDIRIVSSRSSCDLAYLVCIYEATNAGQKVSGRNLIVSRKVRGQWLIVSHMTVVAG